MPKRAAPLTFSGISNAFTDWPIILNADRSISFASDRSSSDIVYSKADSERISE